MTQNTLTTHIQTALTALETLLEQLSGDEIPLDASAPKNIADRSPTEALQNDLEDRFVLHAADQGTFVALDPDWVSLFSEAMFGEEMAPDAEGALDLMQEVSSQGFGTVQSTLAEEGLTLSEVQFGTAAPGQPPPSLDEVGWLVPFTAQRDDAERDGFVLLPDTDDEDEATEKSGDTTEGDTTEAATTSSADPVSSQGAEAPTGGASSSSEDAERVEVSPAAFSELGDEEIGGDEESGTFKLLADVDLEVRVELGRRELPLADVLKLTTGSVVELEKMVGEPLSVYANGRLIAEGEAVVIDEQFGVRITNLASEGDREKAFF